MRLLRPAGCSMRLQYSIWYGGWIRERTVKRQSELNLGENASIWVLGFLKDKTGSWEEVAAPCHLPGNSLCCC